MIKINVADLTVALDNKYSYVEELCKPYLCDGEADFCVSATDEEIEREMKSLSVLRGYAESVALSSALADKLYLYDAFLMHGAVLANERGAYLFSADSGVGKTTHVHLWQSEFPDVGILNGDKPIIRKKDGVFYAAATPWRGKEREGGVGKSPLLAISFIERASENSAAVLSASDSAGELIKHVYIPRSAGAMIKTLSLADELVKSVFSAKLFVNMNKEAATLSRAFVDKNITK